MSLLWIGLGIAIALAGQLLIKLVAPRLKDLDLKKMVGLTAYYGQGIWFSILNGVVNAIATTSVKPLLHILYNPFEYYDVQLTAGDFWIGLVGFATWFMTVFLFYYTLVWKVAEALGAKRRAYAVPPAVALAMLFMYAFGFRATIAIIAFYAWPFALLALGVGIVLYFLSR